MGSDSNVFVKSSTKSGTCKNFHLKVIYYDLDMPSQILRRLVFLSLVALVFSSDSGRLSERNEDAQTKSLFVLLKDFWHWMSWFVRSILSFVYFIFNTIALTLSQIMSIIVSIPQKLIDLVEFVGYCVRFALQANYNFVSSGISIIRRFLEKCFVFIKDLVFSTFKTFKSLFKTILQFFHNVVLSFPKIYGFAGTGAKTSANMVGSLALKTNMSFRAVLSSFGAVVELFGRSIVTTVMLIADLITHLLLTCAKCFQFIGRTIIASVVSAYRWIVLLCQRTGNAVNSFSLYIIESAVSLFRQVKAFTQATVTTIIMGILSVFQTVGLFVIQVSLFIFGGFKQIFISLHYVFSQTFSNMERLVYGTIKTLRESNTSYMYASLSLILGLCLLFIVQKINVLNAGFLFLETTIQGMIMKVTATHTEPITDQEQWSHDINDGAPHGDVENLQKQLQCERDKNLCVVCQDQPKKVLLLPCRHMCICLACANYITSSFQRHRRVCPLCRCRIDSTVEVFS